VKESKQMVSAAENTTLEAVEDCLERITKELEELSKHKKDDNRSQYRITLDAAATALSDVKYEEAPVKQKQVMAEVKTLLANHNKAQNRKQITPMRHEEENEGYPDGVNRMDSLQFQQANGARSLGQSDSHRCGGAQGARPALSTWSTPPSCI